MSFQLIFLTLLTPLLSWAHISLITSVHTSKLIRLTKDLFCLFQGTCVPCLHNYSVQSLQIT